MDNSHEVAPVQISTDSLSLITRGEIDMQIATAHKFPRSIKRFRDEALSMVTLNPAISGECFYALLRKQYDKQTGRYQDVVIEGPSARFAEVIASAWGNCRAGARIVQESESMIVAQGVFHDLERNVAIAYEVQRPIVGSSGKRFKADMIGVTGNAASSIALRNAILKGVPKAFWSDLYTAARQCAVGDFKSLVNRRNDALKEFAALGITKERVFAKLGVAGIEDVTQEHLLLLRGMLTAFRDGDSSPDQVFGDEAPDAQRQPPKVPRKDAEESGAQAPPADDAKPDASAGDPPPEPRRQARPPPADGAASAGEIAHLVARAASRKVRLADVLTACGVDRPDTLEGLTKAEFATIKAALTE